MLRRGETVLGAGDVEAADAAVAELDGQLRDRLTEIRLTHRRENRAHDDCVTFEFCVAHAASESLQHGLDHLVQRQTIVQVQFGSESNLGVDDAITGEVQRRFERDALQVFLGLHHGRRVRETFEVAHEVTPRCVGDEPFTQFVGVVGRQSAVVRLVSEFHHRHRAQTAVQMIVQQNLRCSLNHVTR